jgi:hypothetical protein
MVSFFFLLPFGNCILMFGYLFIIARTAIAFISSYVKLGYVFSMPTSAIPLTIQQEEEITNTVYALASKCLINTKFKSIPTSILATAIIYYARKIAHVCPIWTLTMTCQMAHDPCRDPLGLRALELICIMEDDMASWEELLLTLQDNSKQVRNDNSLLSDDHEHYYAEENSAVLDNEDEDLTEPEYDEREVQEMCNKLNSMLAEIASPVVDKSNKQQEEPSPISIAAIDGVLRSPISN